MGAQPYVPPPPDAAGVEGGGKVIEHNPELVKVLDTFIQARTRQAPAHASNGSGLKALADDAVHDTGT
jgi:hypothetical protein